MIVWATVSWCEAPSLDSERGPLQEVGFSFTDIAEKDIQRLAAVLTR
jgi:hypothetical protein